jgi:predicted RNase H-like HicB family nuclease
LLFASVKFLWQVLKIILMKTKAREFSVLIERDADGYFVATVPALRGCHTQSKSMDQLMVRVREAIELCLEVESEPLMRGDFVGVQRVRV